jgi:tetratricopeptide (TPR) repeat protein
LEAGVAMEHGGDTVRALATYAEAAALATTAAERAEALRRTADVHRTRTEWDDAVAAARGSARVARAAGLEELEAEALNAEAGVGILRGDLATGVALLEAALTLRIGERVRGILWQNLGTVAARAGNPAEVRERFRASAECFARAGYERGTLIALNNMAAADIEYGDPAAALPVLERAAALARALRDADLLLMSVRNSAEAMTRCGRFDEAEVLLGEALGFFFGEANTLRRAECLMILGDVHRGQFGRDDDAAGRCYDRAHEMAVRIGAHGLVEQIAAHRAR